MKIVTILAVLVLAAVLSIVEIPKMLESKSYRDFWAFSILLLLSVSLVILKSLNVSLPNPSKFMSWAFSPISKLIEPIFK